MFWHIYAPGSWSTVSSCLKGIYSQTQEWDFVLTYSAKELPAAFVMWRQSLVCFAGIYEGSADRFGLLWRSSDPEPAHFLQQAAAWTRIALQSTLFRHCPLIHASLWKLPFLERRGQGEYGKRSWSVDFHTSAPSPNPLESCAVMQVIFALFWTHPGTDSPTGQESKTPYWDFFSLQFGQFSSIIGQLSVKATTCFCEIHKARKMHLF